MHTIHCSAGFKPNVCLIFYHRDITALCTAFMHIFHFKITITNIVHSPYIMQLESSILGWQLCLILPLLGALVQNAHKLLNYYAMVSLFRMLINHRPIMSWCPCSQTTELLCLGALVHKLQTYYVLVPLFRMFINHCN